MYIMYYHVEYIVIQQSTRYQALSNHLIVVLISTYVQFIIREFDNTCWQGLVTTPVVTHTRYYLQFTLFEQDLYYIIIVLNYIRVFIVSGSYTFGAVFVYRVYITVQYINLYTV